MWCNTSLDVGDRSYVSHLQREIFKNSDHRLSKIFTRTTRTFPSLKTNDNFARDYLKSAINIFPFQEANFLHALRYQSRLNVTWRDVALSNLLDPSKYFYVRVQSSILLSRYILSTGELAKIRALFGTEADEHVLMHLVFPLSQCQGADNEEIVRLYAHHPNTRIALVGHHISKVKQNLQYGKRFLSHVFEKDFSMRVCDYLGLLWFGAASDEKEILQLVIKHCEISGPRHPVIDIRGVMLGIIQQSEANLAKLS